MSSKSSHLLQYRVELHDQFYRKGHSDQHKVHRLSLLASDLQAINSKVMDSENPQEIPVSDAVRGAIAVIRILNLCNKNATAAFMCDGEADSSDTYALVIEGRALSNAIRELAHGGVVKDLKIVISVAMEMLAVYVRQCWARDVDLHRVIVEELDVEVEDELFQCFHRVEIERLMSQARASLNQPTTHSMLPM
ncbi:hypothetical protein D3C87_1116660 [compost metagenome]